MTAMACGPSTASLIFMPTGTYLLNDSAVAGKKKASLPSWSIIVFLPSLSSVFSPVLNNLLSNVDLDLLKEALIQSAPSWRL